MADVKREQIIIKDSNGEIIFDEKYDNEMLLLKDIQTKVLGRYLIYSKITKNDTTKLKRNEGSTVELINIKSKVLLDLVDRHMLKSFKQFLKMISQEKYYYIDLIGSKRRVNFDLLDVSPKKKDEKTLMCEFELDDDKNLTKIGQEMLKVFMNVEVKTWNKIFLSRKERFKTTVCCDAKTITISNFLLRYIDDDINVEQEKYNEMINTGKKVK